MSSGRRCAVLGKPISHSLSPVLHSMAYQLLGLDWTYEALEVGEEDLANFLSNMDMGWAGLSLTMPLKKTIIPYGTPANEWAKKLKVANTAVFDWSQNNQSPQILLMNTDVYGIARAFSEAYAQHGITPPLRGKGVILGNGNTAISALAAFKMIGNIESVVIGARHPDKETDLPQLAKDFGITLHIKKLDEVFSDLIDANMVVNTIPGTGAQDVADELEISPATVQGVLLDVVYDPRPTALMKAWNAKGGVAIGGERMLLHQAVAQVLLMTGNAEPGDFDSVNENILERWGTLEQGMARALQEAL